MNCLYFSFKCLSRTILSTVLIFGFLHFVLAKDAPFIPGEKTVYKIYYNWNFVWLSAGEVSFEVKDEGDVYHIEVTGKTYSSYEWFYKVRNKYHTYLDKKTLRPKLYIRDIQEGSYYHYEKIIFDYSSGNVYSYTGKSIGTTKMVILPIQDNLFDLISTMYYLRSVDRKDLINKNKIPFKMILDNEIYNLNIASDHQSCVTVKESGRYNTFHCVADVVAGNVFRKNTSLQLKVANDENLIPVLIESPLSIGSVKAILTVHQNLKYPFTAKL